VGESLKKAENKSRRGGKRYQIDLLWIFRGFTLDFQRLCNKMRLFFRAFPFMTLIKDFLIFRVSLINLFELQIKSLRFGNPKINFQKEK